MLDFLLAWRDLRRFKRLPAAERELVFYAEDPATWSHLGPLVECLTRDMGRTVCYVASRSDDPILASGMPGVRSFYVGGGAICTYFFLGLKARVLALTMPDLETFHKKRSKVASVHYAYLFHSMVSTHMIYREHAFDHYDTIFAVGRHHEAEIRATEAVYGLGEKNLVQHGYPRLDAIRSLAASAEAPSCEETPRRLLIAPSWGPQGLLETCGRLWVTTLLAAGYQVTLRPHPETGRRWPAIAAEMESWRGLEGFHLETDIRSQDSFHRAHLMISDWSGVALEYAFGLERPVLFVDVPRKVNNEAWQRLGLAPIEDTLRTELGEIVRADAPAESLDTIARLCAEPSAFRSKIRRARERTVFHLGESARIGAEELARLADAVGTDS